MERNLLDMKFHLHHHYIHHHRMKVLHTQLQYSRHHRYRSNINLHQIVELFHHRIHHLSMFLSSIRQNHHSQQLHLLRNRHHCLHMGPDMSHYLCYWQLHHMHLLNQELRHHHKHHQLLLRNLQQNMLHNILYLQVKLHMQPIDLHMLLDMMHHLQHMNHPNKLQDLGLHMKDHHLDIDIQYNPNYSWLPMLRNLYQTRPMLNHSTQNRSL